MAAEIPLTRGLAALVDDADAEWLSQWKWAACKNRNGFYAMRTQGVGGGRKLHIYMHRLICQPAEGMQVDHINGNKLDNRRTNLRECSPAQNARNCRLSCANTSGRKGVHRNGSIYVAQIKVNGVKKHLGHFTSIEDAHQAYAEAARLYHGVFARSA